MLAQTAPFLDDPAVEELPGDWLVKAALEAEKAAKGHDPRVKVLESVGAEILALSLAYDRIGPIKPQEQ